MENKKLVVTNGVDIREENTTLERSTPVPLRERIMRVAEELEALRLPSLERFKEHLPLEGKALQLFSGQGESLLLAAYLTAKDVDADGLHTQVRQWHAQGDEFPYEVAHLWWELREWRKPLIIYIDLIWGRGEQLRRADFEHKFVFENYPDGAVSYACDGMGIAVERRYQHVIQGFRRDDLKRHLLDTGACFPDHFEKVRKQIDGQIHSTGRIQGAYHAQDLSIWWPFYDLTGEDKDRLLRKLL